MDALDAWIRVAWMHDLLMRMHAWMDAWMMFDLRRMHGWMDGWMDVRMRMDE
jgi:hypothetical protein